MQPTNIMIARPALFAAIMAIMAVSRGTAVHSEEQHGGHQMNVPTAPAARNASCAAGVEKALAIVAGAATRLEAASGRTSTSQMHADITDVQRTVAAAQAELFTCRAAVPAPPVAVMPAGGMAGMDHSKMITGQPAAGAPSAAPAVKPADPMAGMDHSKMDMGRPAAAAKSAQPGAKAADPMAGMDHSKMDMGKPAPAAKSAKPGAKAADPMAGMDHSKMDMSKPAPAAKSANPGAKAADPMAGMDHSKMSTGGGTAAPAAAAIPAGSAGKLPVAMAERIADPACPDNVGKATAAKAVHQRKVYYFCSAAARDEFRKDPVAYLKKHPR